MQRVARGLWRAGQPALRTRPRSACSAISAAPDGLNLLAQRPRQRWGAGHSRLFSSRTSQDGTKAEVVESTSSTQEEQPATPPLDTKVEAKEELMKQQQQPPPPPAQGPLSMFKGLEKRLRSLSYHYGALAVGVHASVWTSTFAAMYLFVDYGVDINSYLAHLPFCGDVINPGKGEDWKGSLLAAYVLTTATGPFRGLLTLAATPVVKNRLNRLGIRTDYQLPWLRQRIAPPTPEKPPQSSPKDPVTPGVKSKVVDTSLKSGTQSTASTSSGAGPRAAQQQLSGTSTTSRSQRRPDRRRNTSKSFDEDGDWTSRRMNM